MAIKWALKISGRNWGLFSGSYFESTVKLFEQCVHITFSNGKSGQNWGEFSVFLNHWISLMSVLTGFLSYQTMRGQGQGGVAPREGACAREVVNNEESRPMTTNGF